MPFPNYAVLLDDFNRANEGPPPSSQWETEIFNPGGDGLSVVTNQIAAPSSQAATGYWLAFQFAPDCEVWADVPTLPVTSGQPLQLMLRLRNLGPVTATGYYLNVNLNGATFDWKINRVDSGGATQLGATVNATLTAGDSLGFEAVGSTLKGYKKTGGAWSEILSRDDSTYQAGGFAAVGIQGTTPRLDNFNAGPVSPETPTTVLRMVKASPRTYA